MAHKKRERWKAFHVLIVILFAVVLVSAAEAATTLYLRDTAASEPMPNAKQSGDTIVHDYATSVATYANPALMTTTAGTVSGQNAATLNEPGANHYTHLGSWISDPVAAQTVSGTVTIGLNVQEYDAKANMNPRIMIYRWTAEDVKGENLLALTTSGTEAPATWPSSPTTYFTSVSLSAVVFEAGDRIVIEVESYDANTRTNSFTQGIRFGGSSGGAYGSYVQFSDDLTFVQVPIADFSADDTTPDIGQTITFSDLSTNIPTSWAWTIEGTENTDYQFVDATSATSQNPKAQFLAAGTYDVSLTATNSAGSDVEAKTDYITVTGASSPPVAAFSGTPRFGTGYVTVQFTDLSTNNPTSWTWDFGDGLTSSEQNPSHLFLGAGYYTVTLTASNSAGSDSETKVNYIYVLGASTQIRIVKYATDNTTILAETTITNKTMEDTLPVVGDGTTHYFHQGPVFLDDPDPVTQEMLRWNPGENVNYLEKDYEAVKGTNLKDLCDLVGPIPEGSRIQVKSTDGWNKFFAYRNVYQYSDREGPMVITWWRPDQGYVPYYQEGMRLIWYADTSTNPTGSHALGNWDWHEAANPAYWYWYTDGVKKYPTTTGISGQKVNEIAIYTGIITPVADFKINRTSEHLPFTSYTGEAPLTVQFIDWSTGDPSSWAWDFNNDGITDSTLERPIHTCTTPGTYTVKLTAANSAGSDTETKTGCIVVTGTTPTIDIDTTGGISNWALVTGTNEDTTSVDLSVTTTASSWEVRVKDGLDDGKPADTAGMMSEYTGSAYVTSGYKSLVNALQVKSGTGSYVTVSGSDQVVQMGSSSGSFSYDIAMKQEIATGDPVITPNVYRIVVTFTGATN